MLKETKRGQATIFVMIALVIVGVFIIIFFYPNIRETVTGTSFSPNNYVRECIEPEIKETMEILSMQGGYSNPEGFIMHGDNRIKFLCYTSDNYDTCTIQQPMIKNHFEGELREITSGKAEQCFASLKEEYERRGYDVTVSKMTPNIAIIPGAVRAEFNAPITASKGDEVQKYNKIEVEIESEIYDLLMIAQSIIDFEANYGDSEITIYMNYYPDLRLEKIKLSDGSKIYKIRNVVTNEEFVFASRSLSWPPGYGLE